MDYGSWAALLRAVGMKNQVKLPPHLPFCKPSAMLGKNSVRGSSVAYLLLSSLYTPPSLLKGVT
jgi:hypothetical protein